jgi:hypothetical protein
VRPTLVRPTLRSGRRSRANGRGTMTRPGEPGSWKAHLTSTKVASKPKRQAARHPWCHGLGHGGRTREPTMVLHVRSPASLSPRQRRYRGAAMRVPKTPASSGIAQPGRQPPGHSSAQLLVAPEATDRPFSSPVVQRRAGSRKPRCAGRDGYAALGLTRSLVARSYGCSAIDAAYVSDVRSAARPRQRPGSETAHRLRVFVVADAFRTLVGLDLDPSTRRMRSARLPPITASRSFVELRLYPRV